MFGVVLTQTCTLLIQVFPEFAVDCLASQWNAEKAKIPQSRSFVIDANSQAFSNKFGEIQEKLEILASMDDLLSGK